MAAEAPRFEAAVPTIPLGKRTLHVIGKRDDDADQPPMLVVEGRPGLRST